MRIQKPAVMSNANQVVFSCLRVQKLWNKEPEFAPGATAWLDLDNSVGLIKSLQRLFAQSGFPEGMAVFCLNNLNTTKRKG